MTIFSKEKRDKPTTIYPVKILKKFFNMTKITSFNTLLQRNGEKNNHSIMYQIDMRILKFLG